jgi:hypothetical protein
MKLTIIALLIALAALGASGFAVFTAVNDESGPAMGWSSTKCEELQPLVDPGGVLFIPCIRSDHDCGPWADMLIAIAENCE